ncbi:hypothetical protein L1887_08980 [Cichorium endivia]|nr:hypothetical protein L1887_08980 [Cichorium endivia]
MENAGKTEEYVEEEEEAVQETDTKASKPVANGVPSDAQIIVQQQTSISRVPGDAIVSKKLFLFTAIIRIRCRHRDHRLLLGPI